MTLKFVSDAFANSMCPFKPKFAFYPFFSFMYFLIIFVHFITFLLHFHSLCSRTNVLSFFPYIPFWTVNFFTSTPFLLYPPHFPSFHLHFFDCIFLLQCFASINDFLLFHFLLFYSTNFRILSSPATLIEFLKRYEHLKSIRVKKIQANTSVKIH